MLFNEQKDERRATIGAGVFISRVALTIREMFAGKQAELPTASA